MVLNFAATAEATFQNGQNTTRNNDFFFQKSTADSKSTENPGEIKSTLDPFASHKKNGFPQNAAMIILLIAPLFTDCIRSRWRMCLVIFPGSLNLHIINKTTNQQLQVTSPKPAFPAPTSRASAFQRTPE